MTSCPIMGMAKTVAPKPATRSGSGKKCWNDCGGTLIGCFNRQRLRDEARARVRAPRFGADTRAGPDQEKAVYRPSSRSTADVYCRRYLQPELIISTEDYYRRSRPAGFAVGFQSRA